MPLNTWRKFTSFILALASSWYLLTLSGFIQHWESEGAMAALPWVDLGEFEKIHSTPDRRSNGNNMAVQTCGDLKRDCHHHSRICLSVRFSVRQSAHQRMCTLDKYISWVFLLFNLLFVLVWYLEYFSSSKVLRLFECCCWCCWWWWCCWGWWCPCLNVRKVKTMMWSSE